ncbi:Pantothenate synthetase [Taphrina deformans PYCC 5710]|uniref:Pantoate--beta-alanine ligase n=1 Tax=Taphrina deformans (strain PYCC 5710 / ATCC 11124 / CBS 356.35 / IMI 108563 / JCM 9778 / NBRC 8474) TaxID=1097556 RepID=R4XBE5_TAPDE|nr:Pantothenate synthetase [Taphrina deformans PYCC 5710]|eukprot:CCG83179.1 Pantothenate synthetase [Taphrina deformans PYCC 5710]
MGLVTDSLKPLILRSTAEYRSWRRCQSSTIGFVPTMGALHAGHLSLAQQARRETSLVVMSIFVNPAQFAPTEDLQAYPRTLDADLTEVRRAGTVDVLFLPTTQDLYPHGIEQDVTRQSGAFVSVLGLSHQLEGSIRPTFFRGVATILTKFLNVVRPDVMYLGQKDIQQSVVVRRLMADLCFDTVLRVGPTVRDPDGLALSSRNIYLGPQDRVRATCLYRALRAAETAFEQGETDGPTLRQAVRAVLDREEGVEVEYVSVADLQALREVDRLQHGQEVVVSAAVRLGATRILDNIILRNGPR